ncbi:MAG: universal stress protein [Cyclobacteriaceae bacterium]
MKKILVPTDFSDCAGYAVKLAIELALTAKGEVEFLHIMAVPPDWVTLDDSKRPTYPEVTKMVKKANHDLDQLVALAEKSGVKAQRFLCYNKNYKAIIDHQAQYKNDFVVMGSHGATGFKELFIGSSTQKVVRLSPVPVLTVKKPVSLSEIKDIVFASDFEEAVMDPFQTMVNFSRIAEAKLHLLFINTPTNFTDSLTTKTKMGNYAMHAPGMVEATHVFNYNQFERGLDKFCQEMQMDLISMITHGAGFLSGSITERVVNHTDLPILSLHMPN